MIDDLIRDPEEADRNSGLGFRSKIESLGLELPKEKQRDFNEINLQLKSSQKNWC